MYVCRCTNDDGGGGDHHHRLATLGFFEGQGAGSLCVETSFLWKFLGQQHINSNYDFQPMLQMCCFQRRFNTKYKEGIIKQCLGFHTCIFSKIHTGLFFERGNKSGGSLLSPTQGVSCLPPPDKNSFPDLCELCKSPRETIGKTFVMFFYKKFLDIDYWKLVINR